ncbi:hypothetical protein RirG_117600 [Rhizophagus irregularis DAOM 197198w]|uniref:Protein kinase domain-containing protein n=3 Tax=Rhizophagus irregularis TaxID=588596 RepID=A0A015L3T1_RHIIW|nr:hypothetical protein RirG_117600 [Rhizophagus irregularis DAOM 197198w]
MMVSDDFKDLKDQCEKCGKNYYIWCDSCQINELKNNFGNWTSGDEKIDNFIQEMQLKIYYDNDIIVEWIPYNQFDNIKKINKDGFATVYSAIWKDGPLDDDQKKKKRINNKKVTLKCLYNSKYTIDEFLNEAKTYSINEYDHNILKIYGISQNPNTKDYIMVLQDGYCEKCGEIYTNISNKRCKSCQMNDLKENLRNWTSKNKKIDELIRDMYLKFDYLNGIIFEWIPFNQFNNIKEINKGNFATVYLATWNDGPLYFNKHDNMYKRNQNMKVILKSCYNSQNITDEFLDEVRSYSIYEKDVDTIKIFGISQNPDTKDYIIVLKDGYCEKCGNQYTNIRQKWCKSCQIDYLENTCIKSGNGNIDNFIQEMRLKINHYDNIAVGWIPYNKQPFVNCVHDQYLTLNICNGVS